ncbi:hypothetical protein LPLAFNJD_LOCUS1782 [Methylorubrum aminovorans]
MYTIHNDVLLSESGYAFLIGGNHSVLRFMTGEISPSEQSFLNFANNVAHRYSQAAKSGSRYAHVLFPDKQSVMDEAFPIKGIVRLGDFYIERANAAAAHVVYPIAALKAAENPSYYPLDTHMTDHGSLIMLRAMLKSVDIEANEAIDKIGSRIVKVQETFGDLGSKFTPPMRQTSIVLDPDWQFVSYSGAKSFNDGQIDIRLNPYAPVRQRVLLFGDSFFRLMLNHLSGVFNEVICLRTRFYHEEMVASIKPDVIFTGNAERYLSSVISDEEAHPFFLYPLLRKEAPPEFTHDFVDAYRALTSPRSEFKRVFFARIKRELKSLPPKGITDEGDGPDMPAVAMEIEPAVTRADPEGTHSIIVGPSHAVRWKKLRLEMGVMRPASTDSLVGFGGAPLWSKRNLELARTLSEMNDRILMIVGDFRFGNPICLEDKEPAELFVDGFSGISQSAVTPFNDMWMFKRAMRALDAWQRQFPGRLRFMFWDLFCRQVQDRLVGRYVDDNAYRHPTWELTAVEEQKKSLPIISMSPLLSEPMHQAMRLFIDSSSHPSHAGYLFINKVFFENMDTLQAYKEANAEVLYDIIALVEHGRTFLDNPIVLIGRSVWLNTLMRYLGRHGVERMAKAGIKLVSLNPVLGHPPADMQALYATDPSKPLYVISGSGAADDIIPYIADAPDTFRSTLAAAKFFAWEANCADIIGARTERPAFTCRKEGNVYRSLAADIRDEHVELGQNAEPTMSGIMMLLKHLVADR